MSIAEHTVPKAPAPTLAFRRYSWPTFGGIEGGMGVSKCMGNVGWRAGNREGKGLIKEHPMDWGMV